MAGFIKPYTLITSGQMSSTTQNLTSITAAGQFICHQCHYQGAKVKIMGSLQFKNSFYCSFSRDKML